MGRRAEGWKLRTKGDTLFVRFRHEGRRYDRSTGTGDPVTAAREAARIYAETVSGRVVRRSGRLDEMFADWLAEYEKAHAKGTAATVTGYVRAALLPFFEEPGRITKESALDYARARLTQATRSTVRKELSALRQFVSWAGLDVEIPGLPRHGHPGKRSPNARKRRATVLTPDQVERLLRALPERGERHKAHVRAFFRVLWETALRESTVFALEAPLHYRKGAKRLFVTREIDKAFDERHLALTPAARKALDLVVPEVGRLFTPFDLRGPLRAACIAAKLPRISPYDLRHSRITSWANSGAPLTGVMHLAGHASLATTARYVVSDELAADAVLRASKRRAR